MSKLTEKLKEYEIRRSGADSSEFKTLIASLIIVPFVGVLNNKFNWNIPPQEFSQMIFGIYTAVSVYVAGRHVIKATRNIASAKVESAEIKKFKSENDCEDFNLEEVTDDQNAS